MSPKIFVLCLFILISFGTFSSAFGGRMSTSLKDVVIEERNQQTCEGPLNTNCPRDGKILGDLTWSPFSNENQSAPPPPDDATAAQIEGIQYADSNPLEE